MKYIIKCSTLLALALLTLAQPATAQNNNTTVITEDQETIEQGKYTLLNNKFGNPFAGQVIWRYAVPGFWNWGSWFDKTDFGSINSPAMVLGWHWSTPRPETELPTRIWDNAPVNARANWSLSELPIGGTRVLNVGYHMWFHDDDQVSDGLDWQDTPRAEIAVWLHHQGGITPAGTWQENIFYAGREWELWRGVSGGGWDVFTFRPYVGQESVNDTELRLSGFIHEIVYIQGALGNDLYLSGVEFGPEVEYATNTIFQLESEPYIDVTESESQPQPEPSGNTMYVDGRHLHAPNGDRVILRGINAGLGWVSADSREGHIREIAKTGANCLRIVWVVPGTDPYHTRTNQDLDNVLRWSIENGMIPMIMIADSAGQPLNSQALQDRLAYWTDPDVVAVLKKHERWLILNMFNEAGNPDGPDPNFVPFYTEAINQIRDAGITVPLVIDASSFGQAFQQIFDSWELVRASDENHFNLLFSIHTYFHGTDFEGSLEQKREIYDTIIDRAIADNIPLIFGEGPTPTDFRCDASPWEYALQRMQDNDMSWLVWSWGVVRNDDCGDEAVNQFDLTREGAQFGDWNTDYARQILVDHPNSIKNTSVRPAELDDRP